LLQRLLSFGLHDLVTAVMLHLDPPSLHAAKQVVPCPSTWLLTCPPRSLHLAPPVLNCPPPGLHLASTVPPPGLHLVPCPPTWRQVCRAWAAFIQCEVWGRPAVSRRIRARQKARWAAGQVMPPGG
jgi:hypothetical protein